MIDIMTGFRAHTMPGRARRRGVNVGDKERFFSALGGGALLLYALGKRGVVGTALSALGWALVTRGATGQCAVYRAVGIDSGGRQQGMGRAGVATTVPGAIRVEQSVTVQRPREELYRFFSDLTNLPRFMAELEQVKPMGSGRSRWVAKGPRGTTIAWDMETIEDVENERIVWRSIDAQEVMRSAIVSFATAPGERGTEVTMVLDAEPRKGLFGKRPTLLQCEASELKLRSDLRRFKQLMEAGEIPTTVGQPSGRKGE